MHVHEKSVYSVCIVWVEHAVRSVYTISEFLFGHTDAVQGSSPVEPRPRSTRPAPRPPAARRLKYPAYPYGYPVYPPPASALAKDLP